MRRVTTFKRPRKGWKVLDVMRKPSAVELREHQAKKAGPISRQGKAADRRRRQIEAGQLKPDNGLRGE